MGRPGFSERVQLKIKEDSAHVKYVSLLSAGSGQCSSLPSTLVYYIVLDIELFLLY